MTATTQYLDVPHESPDEWHRHSREDGAPQPEHAGHVNALALWIAFGAMVVFLAAVIGGLILYYNQQIVALRQERLETTRLAEEFGIPYKEQAMSDLASYGIVNPEAETYQIPIDQAMDKVIQAYQNEGP